jgi:hypothetical protein
MAPEVIEALYQALKQSPPQAAEGFIALYALDPRQGLDIGPLLWPKPGGPLA